MKTIYAFLTAAVLVSDVWAADYRLAEQSPGGFIHVQRLDQDPSVAKSYYLSTRHVIDIVVFRQSGEYGIRIRTTAADDQGHDVTYFIKAKDIAEADLIAKRVFSLIALGKK